MSVNLLREKQMEAAELEVLYWERKLKALEKPKESAKGDTYHADAYNLCQRAAEVVRDRAAKKENNYSVNYDPIIKVTDDGGLTASQVAVEAYKKRLVDRFIDLYDPYDKENTNMIVLLYQAMREAD